MLAKNYTPKRTICKVTFTMPADVVSEKVSLAGEFNDWDPSDHQLEIELRLKPESTYRFKYLIDDQVWENDYAADEYIPNDLGTEDSVVVIGK